MVLRSSMGLFVEVHNKKPVIAIPNILLFTRMQAHHWMYIRYLRAQEVDARPSTKKDTNRKKVHCLGSTYIADRVTRTKLRLGTSNSHKDERAA